MEILGGKCEGCGSRTYKKDERNHYKCSDCQEKEEIKKKMDAEKKVKCPIDGQIMTKESIRGIIIDRCPACKGVWLDGGEIEKLRELLEHDSGDSDNFATGLAVGLAIN